MQSPPRPLPGPLSCCPRAEQLWALRESKGASLLPSPLSSMAPTTPAKGGLKSWFPCGHLGASVT